MMFLLGKQAMVGWRAAFCGELLPVSCAGCVALRATQKNCLLRPRCCLFDARNLLTEGEWASTLFFANPDDRPWRGATPHGRITMLNLDVSPMIAALRETPDEFALAGGWLNHIRSRHTFRFGPTDEG